jgi:hypothetical protein
LLIVRVGTFVLTGARDGCFVDTKISTEGVWLGLVDFVMVGIVDGLKEGL